MGEPRLEDIGDYDTLKGEKKKVVWAIILAFVVIGVVYAFISNMYDTVDDSIEVKETSQEIPIR